MKYAILGDIHANQEALEAVLEECSRLKVDKYLCIGDIVGYNANPSECVDTIRGLGVEVVTKGNHDEQASSDTELVGFNPQAAMAIEWTRHQLSPTQKEWLGGLPYRQTLGPKVTLVHATLDMPHMWGYIFDKLTAAACLNYQFTQICFFGHTHIPLVFDKFGDITGGKFDEILLKAGHKYLINVCSVGQPRDGDPRSGFVTYSPEELRVRIHRVEYDVRKCQQKILRAGLPERLAQRLAFGR